MRLRLACLCVFDGFNKNANTCINITECYYEMKTQQVEKKETFRVPNCLNFISQPATSQTKGRSSVCTLMCVTNSEFFLHSSIKIKAHSITALVA